MKTILLTGYDGAMRELGDLTAPLMFRYATARGWDFKCHRSAQFDLSIYWNCVLGTFQALTSGYKRVVWIEADQIITNPDYELPELSPGLHVSRDWGADAVDDNFFSACSWVASRDSLKLFERVLAIEPEWRDKLFPCQAPLQHIRRTEKWAEELITVHPRRMFNAVPKLVSEGAVEPWEPEDWLCHLTHVDLKRRIELFHMITNSK